MEVTTIKLHVSTKKSLDVLRDERESYDEVICKLVERLQDTNLHKELTEGYSRIGNDELDVLKEWEHASNEVPQ